MRRGEEETRIAEAGHERTVRSGNLAGARLDPGSTFGRWTITRYSHKDRRNAYFVCRCVCGRVGTVRRWSLVSGHSRSCGCLANDNRREWTELHKGVHHARRTMPRPKRVRVSP